MNATTKTIADVRIAVVQLECHPCFTLGAVNYLKEPFSSEEPILQSLANLGVEVNDLQQLCFNKYLLWHCARLTAVVDWLNNLDVSVKPHVVVFSEGAVPRQFLKCLRKRLNFNCLVFAGTHALDDSILAWEEYENLGVSSEVLDGVRARSSSRTTVMPVLGETSLDPHILNPIQDIHGTSKKRKGKNLFKLSVNLRPKFVYSPHEAPLIGQHFDNFPPDLPTYELRVSDGENVSQVTVLPLICSEALQYLGSKAMNEADVVVISSYDSKHANFRALQDHLASNQIPTIYCNDGRFGGSGIAIKTDARPEPWWFTSAASHGTLPQGDAVLIMKVRTGSNATQVGVFDPEQNHTLLKLTPIIPVSADSQSYQIAQLLDQFRDEVTSQSELNQPVDTENVKRILSNILDRNDCTEVHRACISRLLNLAKNDHASVQEWKALSDSVKIGRDAIEHAERVFRKTVQNVSNTHRIRKERGIPQPTVSLKELERELSLACYLKCRLLIEEDTYKSDRTKNTALLNVRAKLKANLQGRVPLSPLESAHNFIESMKLEAIQSAKDRLKAQVAAITERFGATAGMLFIVKDPPSIHGYSDEGSRRLVCDIAFNVPYPKIERKIAVTGEGIVGHVAATGQSYLINNVRDITDKDRKLVQPETHLSNYIYRKTIPSTKSEVVVPIYCPSPAASNGASCPVEMEFELIGVLNLEARYPGAFAAVQVSEVESAAAALAPGIQVLRSSEGVHSMYGWNPECHKWDRTELLNKLCAQIASAAQTGSFGTSASCTIWHFDQIKECLYVKGTSKFDYEYIAESTLPVESLVGRIARDTAHGRVLRGSVDDFQEFRRPNKAGRMEVSRIIATPIYEIASPNASEQVVEGVLTVYSFKHEQGQGDFALDHVFSNAVVTGLATLIGGFIDSIRKIQARIALATLYSRLQESSVKNFDEFEQIRQVCSECLNSEWCSVFMKVQNKLVCVSTSGLIGNPGDKAYDLEEPQPIVYDHKRIPLYQAITPFVGANIGCSLRKHNVPDAREIVKCIVNGLERKIRIIPQNRLREAGAPTRTAHRRILAASVTRKGRVVGVVRLVRGDSQRPFVEADETMLHLLVQSVANIFDRHTRHREQPQISNSRNRAVGKLLEQSIDKIVENYPPTQLENDSQQLGAFKRLTARLGASAVNRKWLDSCLQDIVAVFEARRPSQLECQKPVHVSLRIVVERGHGSLFLKLLAYHAIANRRQGWDDHEIARTQRCMGWFCIDGMTGIGLGDHSPGVISFDAKDNPPHYLCPVHALEEVASGITVPVVWVGRHGKTRGCISLDFANGVITKDMVKSLWFSSLSLAIFGVSARNAKHTIQIMRSLEEWLQQMFPNVPYISLIDGSGTALHNFSQVINTTNDSWEAWASTWDTKENHANSAGVMVSKSRSCVVFPLWLGGFRVCRVELRFTKEKKTYADALPIMDPLNLGQQFYSEPSDIYSSRLVSECLLVQESWTIQAITSGWFWKCFDCDFTKSVDSFWKASVWAPRFVLR
ncbi:hypothetical protein EI77_00076 [Prosthecobacter fusiformis]|uniref:GAF domain-containing protein n=1 Tax=Prosthecobacter fusiformis TaxID=48464 RepID=A0A4R7SQB7_9BACT|nr:GAF domain-containing protein [Prosthecobacter fusiformis]TDU80779.1 hypothetical protein EI77_00076 [Prosthecobacter fusiformis]